MLSFVIAYTSNFIQELKKCEFRHSLKRGRRQVILPNIVKPLNNSKYIYINCSNAGFISL